MVSVECYLVYMIVIKGGIMGKNNKKNRWGKCLSNISTYLAIFAAVCTIIITVLFFKGINSMSDYRNKQRNKTNSVKAASIWKEDLNVLRLEYDKEYIENTIGIPQASQKIEYEGLIFNETIYVNNYFSLMCFYGDSGNLLGYLIIGNNPKFDFENYRCPFKLFGNSINATKLVCEEYGVGGLELLRSHSGGRIDNNNYYFECDLQHSKGGGQLVLIGFGICDIGYLENRDEVDKMFVSMHKLDVDARTTDEKTPPDDEIRNETINSFMVFMCNYYDVDLMDFIRKNVVMDSALGICREEYANAKDNYTITVDSFLQKVQMFSKDFIT